MKTIKAIVMAIVPATALVVAQDARSDEAQPQTRAAWLLAATSHWVKPFAVQAGAIVEDVDAHAARRAAIVEAVDKVTADAAMPSLFPSAVGADGRALSALMVLSVFRFESHFDVRVQSHHCKGLPKGSCDGGKAWCLGQVHPEDVPQLADLGWKGEDLQADVEKCVKATLWRLDAARRACSVQGLEGGDRFSSYATGKCGRSEIMQLRYGAAAAWLKAHPAPHVKKPS